MFSVASAEIIVSFILLLVAYLLSVTLTGTAHAVVARTCGDHSAEDEGFLSGNPSVYIDFLGILCLIFCGFGWGRRPPFHTYLVSSPYKSLKVLLVYATEALCSLGIAFISLLVSISLAGKIALYIAHHYHVIRDPFEKISFYDMSSCIPHAQSLHLLIIMFCTILMSLNILLALWSIINNICHYALYLGAEHNLEYVRHETLILMGGPLILFICIAPTIYGFLIYSVCKMAYITALLLGLL